MPWYKTGRQRDIVLEATINGRWAGPISNGAPDDELQDAKYLEGYLRIANIFPAYIEVGPYHANVTPSGHPIGHRHYSTGIKVIAHVGTASATAIMYDWEGVAVNDHQWSQWDKQWSCFGSIVVPTDEYRYYGQDGPTDEDGFPTYGGAALKDFPFPVTCRHLDVPRANSTIVATLTCGTATASIGTVIPEQAIPFVGTDYDYWFALCNVSYSAQNAADGLQASITMNGELLTKDWTGTATVSDGTAIANASSCGLVVAGGRFARQGWASIIQSLDVRYRAPLAIISGVSPYPDALDVLWAKEYGKAPSTVPVTGTGMLTAVQEAYEFRGGLAASEWLESTQMLPGSAMTQGSVRAWLSGQSLSSLHESAADWRLMFHGPPYDAIGLSCAMEAKLSYSGSQLPGTVTVNSPNLSGYRWLRLKTTAGTPNVTLAIGAKQFLGAYDGGFIWFDLCGPVNCAVKTDAMDTAFPRNTVAQRVNTVSGDGVMWGVEQGSALVFSGDAGTIASKGLALVVRDRADAWFNPRRAPSIVWPLKDYDPNEEAETRVRRFLDCDVDGRRCIEQPDGICICSTPWQYYEQDIGQLVQDVQSLGALGWSATALCPATDLAEYSDETEGYLTRLRPATWINGGGLMAVAGMGGSLWGPRPVPLIGSNAIQAQPLLDAVRITPLWGDGFKYGGGEFGAPGDYGTVCVGKLMRANATGLVYTSSMVRSQNAKVTMQRQDTMDSAGSDTSDDWGCYETGLPYGIGLIGHYIICDGTVTATAYSADRIRACFGAAPEGINWISYAVSPDKRHARAYIRDDKIVLGFSSDPTADTWRDANTDVSGSCPSVSWTIHSRCNAVSVDYASNNIVYNALNLTEGGYLTNMQALGNGAYPVQCITRDGRHLHYWVSNGAIKGLWLNSMGGTVMPEFTAVPSGVDNDAIDADYYELSGNTFSMNLLYRSGGNLVLVRSKDGVNFS